jgi:hypothetical protein
MVFVERTLDVVLATISILPILTEVLVGGLSKLVIELEKSTHEPKLGA